MEEAWRVAHPIDFTAVPANEVESRIDTLLASTTRALKAIGANEEAPTFETTLGALDAATADLEHAMGVVGHLEATATTPAFRDAYNAVQPRVAEFWSQLPFVPGLWDRLRAYAETPHGVALEGPERRLLDKTLREFRRAGADLAATDRDALVALEVELAKVTNQFSQNVLDATNAFELIVDDVSALEGMPASAIATARRSAESKGRTGWRLTLEAPCVTAVLTHADDRTLREQIWRANSARGTKAPWDNRALVGRVLELRKKKAAILGFEHFADWVLEDRMATSAARASEFIEDLAQRTRPAFDRERDELHEFRAESGGGSDPIEPWDVAYWDEKLRRARFDVDEERVREFLPADSVIEGMFGVVQRLYGVRMAPVDLPVWDPAVRAYALTEDDGTELGWFYADLHPRENKRGGAWAHHLVRKAAPEPQIAVLVANVNAPADGAPALLTHAEAETCFHELGHLMHMLLSRVSLRALSGAVVPWDFVELPSQIMENFCWEPSALARIGRHHATGEPMPSELIDRLTRARTFRAATRQMRQLGLAALDLALHTTYDPARDGDPVEYAASVQAPFSPVRSIPGHGIAPYFTHIFGDPTGYAAGYYSYKWAEMLEADAFTRFREQGIFERPVGLAFRSTILERGDTRDPNAMLEEFLGRPARVDALLERLGLV